MIDLDECADWQIHRRQIARAVGIAADRIPIDSEDRGLGLLNVIESKTAEGKNKANRFVPMINKFIEYAVVEDESSAEAAEAVARALDSATECHQSRLEDTDVPLTTAPTAVTASTATKTNKPNKTESTVVLADETEARRKPLRGLTSSKRTSLRRCQEMRMVSVEKMAASVIHLLRQVIQLLRRQMRYGKGSIAVRAWGEGFLATLSRAMPLALMLGQRRCLPLSPRS